MSDMVHAIFPILLLILSCRESDSPGEFPGLSDKNSYKLVWSDDFDYPNPQLDVEWNSQNGPSGHILCSRWRENAVVENGTLKLKYKKEKRIGCLQFVSGWLNNGLCNAVVNNYKVQYYNGSDWVDVAIFDVSLNEMNLGKEFHICGLEWTKDSLIFSFDGKVIRRMKNEFCHSPAPIYLSEAIISWAGEVTGAIDGTCMEVDWVKVYQ